MNTKDQILFVSLRLFAIKGFDGVSVREIAKEVGVRESALYKHYKNKEDILNSIIDVMKERIAATYLKNQVPEAVSENVSKGYEELSYARLCEISWNLFQLFTKDPLVSDYRKLLMREQFSNKRAAKQYSDFFISGVIRKQSKTFAQLVDSGFFKEIPPEVIALQFYGPIFLLFQQYDCNPETEDQIKETLFRHVKVFGDNFSMKG